MTLTRHTGMLLLLILGWASRVFGEVGLPVPASSQDGYYLFEENKGQFHPNVLFRCRLPNGYLFLEEGGLTYLLEDQMDRQRRMDQLHRHEFIGPQQPLLVHSHAVKVAFKDHQKPWITANHRANGYLNYFKGTLRVSEVYQYQTVIYHNIYPGIDLKFYNNEGNLKIDWIITAEASCSNIQLVYSGADKLAITEGGLQVSTSVGNMMEAHPFTTLLDSDVTLPEVAYQLNDSTLSYQLKRGNEQYGYIIDPKLIFSTYSGSRGDNFGFTATYDSRGNLFAGGITDGNQGSYPVTAGAIQETYGGGGGSFPANLACDITISKYDSAGTKLLWATYLGGWDDEYPHSLVTDRDDDLLVMGTTYSTNFPTTLTAYDTTFNGGVDIIVSKISSDGKTLMGSTFVGGSDVDGLNSNTALRYNYADDFRGDIIPDENKNVFIASCTESDDFPLVKAFDTSQKFQDGCVFELNSDLSKLLWSSYAGGSSRDALYSIRLDADSFAYVAGGTSSSDLKTSAGVVGEKYGGSVDGYVMRLDRKNRKLSKTSYWGTTSYDQVYFLDLDDEGHVYLAGQTTGNVTVSANVYGTDDRGQFIVKLDSSLNQINWQTTFGVRKNQIDFSPSAFLVDNCDHIYVSGWGSNVRPDLNPGSTVGLETTSDAIQKTTDGNDFYIIVLNKDAESLLYATYFGGDTSDDHVDGGTSRFDKKGVVYQSVCSSCPNGSEPGHQDFPVTPNAAFTTNFSPRCSNASFKIDLQIKDAIDAYFVPDPIIGCMPLTVNFDNRSDQAKRFRWDFGDGTTDTSNLHPTHTFDKPGTYTITLEVEDSATCNINDDFRRTIEVLDGSDASFEYSFNACTNEVEFRTDSEGPDFLWRLGDGNTETKTKFSHTYPAGGSFDIWLVVNQGSLCADSVKQTLNTNDPGQRDLLVPNVFTPNNDGYNDEYCLDGFTPGCDEIELIIYNRWGERVFETDDLTKCWDGSVLNAPGRIHPPGTYFYILKVSYGDTHSTNTISGTVTLIRDP